MEELRREGVGEPGHGQGAVRPAHVHLAADVQREGSFGVAALAQEPVQLLPSLQTE